METCSECERPVYAKGLCSAHYQRRRYHGELPGTPSRVCEFCGQLMTGGNRAARYCSRSCIDKANNQRRRAAILAAAGERRCVVCDKVLPDSVHVDAKCYSPACRSKYQNCKQRARKR
ncbi:MAG TPA: hypothetical protein VIV12_04230, partial [Streptosporangiaceae bacterium]